MKRITTFIVIILVGVQVMAQRQVRLSEYYFNPLSYNPAYAGTRDAISLTATHRQQWSGIKGTPQTTYLSVHSPIGKSHLALGGDFAYDKIGVSTTTSAYLDIAYYIQVNDKGDRLSFGLKGGINVYDVSLSDLYGGTDPLKKNVDNKLKANFGGGMYYYGAKYFAGISALSILESSIWDDANDPKLGKLKRQYYLTGGYVFDLGTNFKLRPTAVVKLQEDEDTVFDGEVALNVHQKFWVGVGYDTDKDVRGYALFNVTPQFRLGYNYTYLSNDIGKYSGGTHEFVLGYDISRHKSRFDNRAANF